MKKLLILALLLLSTNVYAFDFSSSGLDDGSRPTADQVEYDNSESSLEATNVQDAIDEVADMGTVTIESDDNLVVLGSHPDFTIALSEDVTIEGNLGVSSISKVNYVELRTDYANGSAEGRLQWNAEDGTPEVGMPGGNVNLQLGQEMLIRATNKDTSQINNGDVVYISGGSGANVYIKKASNATLATATAIGVATENIAQDQKGYVTTNGLVRDVNTDGLTDGTILWLSQSGAFTATRPDAPLINTVVGQVIRGHATEGVIHANIFPIPKFNGLSDVKRKTLTESGTLATWDNDNQYFAFDYDIDDYVEELYWDNVGSAGRLWGGTLSDAGGGKVDIAAGAGLIKVGESSLNDYALTISGGQASRRQLVTWDAIEDFPVAGVGYNLVYWDASAGEFAVQLKENFYANFDFTSDFTIGRIHYDGYTVVARLCGMNLWNFDRRVQMFGEERFPVERAFGMMIGATGTRNFSLTAGVIWAELVNRFPVNAFDSSTGGTFTYWYRSGTPNEWLSTSGNTQISNVYYDDGDGTLGEVSASPLRYGVHWVYECHDSSVHVVYGQGSYTLTQAQNATVPATLPSLVGSYATLVGKIIIARKATSFTSIQSPFTTQFAYASASNHNDLGGLQGGTTNEYYHLTAAQANDIQLNSNLTADTTQIATVGGWDTTASDDLVSADVVLNADLTDRATQVATAGGWDLNASDDITSLASLTTDITTTGDVYATKFFGDGSALTGIEAGEGGGESLWGYMDSTTLQPLTVSDNVSIGNNLSVNHNLAVDGQIFGGQPNYIGGLGITRASNSELTVSGGGIVVNGIYRTIAAQKFTINPVPTSDVVYMYVGLDGNLTHSVTEPTLQTDNTWTSPNLGRCIFGSYCTSDAALWSFFGTNNTNVYEISSTQIATNVAPNGTWQAPNVQNTSFFIPVMAHTAIVSVLCNDTSAIARVYAASADAVSAGAGVSSAYYYDQVGASSGTTYAILNRAYITLGASRNIYIGADDDDNDDLDASLNGWIISR